MADLENYLAQSTNADRLCSCQQAIELENRSWPSKMPWLIRPVAVVISDHPLRIDDKKMGHGKTGVLRCGLHVRGRDLTAIKQKGIGEFVLSNVLLHRGGVVRRDSRSIEPLLFPRCLATASWRIVENVAQCGHVVCMMSTSRILPR